MFEWCCVTNGFLSTNGCLLYGWWLTWARICEDIQHTEDIKNIRRELEDIRRDICVIKDNNK